jgi:hypothetical protein
MHLANHVWKKHPGWEIPEAMDEAAASYVGEVHEYFSARASLAPETTTSQENWWGALAKNWTKCKLMKNFEDSTALSELVGGKIRAIKYMNGLLEASNGYYTWDNYGRFWDTDHSPIPYASIIPGNTSTYFSILHFRNLRPYEHHPNMTLGCRR